MIEMLVVLSIMGIVMTGLTTAFVSGSKAENDLNRRYQAQQDTRLALDRIRKDIHCANDVNPYAQNSVTLKATACAGDISWCTAAVAGPITRYALYRQAGTACSSGGGLKVADYLTTGNVFTAFTHATGTLAALSLDFPISIKGTRIGQYDLKDAIYLRNSTRP
jgi:type II secretory pathway pseudopilin PulG